MPIVAVYMPPPRTNPAPDVASITCNVSLDFLVRYHFFCDTLFTRSFQLIFFVLLLFPEQGRRNDLSNPPSDVDVCDKMPPCHVALCNKIIPTDNQSLSPPVNVISDSVHCNPLRQSSVSSGFSCHIDDKLSDEVDEVPSVVLNRPSSPPSWVHVFSKSSSTTSLRTQCDPNTPLIKPPDGVRWRSLSFRMLHIPHDNEPNIGLTAPRMDEEISAFIRLPRQMSLDIIGDFDLDKILSSLTACENLRQTALSRGDAARVFTDYGKRVSYACVGPQPSRNSKTVRSHPPFTQALPECHWQSLVWMMKRAEDSFLGLLAINGFHNSIFYPSCSMVIIQKNLGQLPVPFNSIASVSVGTAKNNRHYGGS